MNDFTPEELSRGSQAAAAFLAHYATHDGAGLIAVLGDVDEALSREATVFAYAMASIANHMGVQRLGLDAYLGDLRAVAVARAGDGGGGRDL